MTTNLRKQLKMFKDQVETVQKSWQETNKKLEEERGRRYAAEREVEETRKQFVDLKKRLHEAEMMNARNEGYLQRVREDDCVNDPLIEIEDANGKRMVSKRFPNPQYPQYNESYSPSMSDMIMDKINRKHWTSY